MTIDLTPHNQYIEDMMYMQWLRPENIPWDTHAASLVYPYLRTDDRKIEIGIGNGYTSFSILGGRFRKEFDWYFSVNTEGFWKKADIYDHDLINDFFPYVEDFPKYQFELALDHKENLLNQAHRLKTTKSIKIHDANKPTNIGDADIVFSNILYWLRDPISTFKWISDGLKPGAKLVTLIPNSRYKEYSRSFKQENKLWTMLNKGRADQVLWSIDPDEFQKMIKDETELSIEEHSLYCSRQTLSIVDIGLRPFSPYMIKMANSLSPADRFEIKKEWCDELLPLAQELCIEELQRGPKEGGFSFYLLRK